MVHARRSTGQLVVIAVCTVALEEGRLVHDAWLDHIQYCPEHDRQPSSPYDNAAFGSCLDTYYGRYWLARLSLRDAWGLWRRLRKAVA